MAIGLDLRQCYHSKSVVVPLDNALASLTTLLIASPDALTPVASPPVDELCECAPMCECEDAFKYVYGAPPVPMLLPHLLVIPVPWV